MNAELLYTSAPQGLKQGSRGFCTVLSTVGMPLNIATKLESLSGYRHLYPSGTPDATKNPVSYSHLKLSVGGRMISVISRISDYGLDYSQRTNKLAHHIVVDAPLPNCGPAALLADPSIMRTQWDGNCINVPTPPALSATALEPAPCSTWGAITGDAGWGGVLANAWLNPSSKPIFVVFSEDQSVQVLSLIEEAIALLPPAKRWQATFGTYVTNLPPDVECKVRCVVAGSEEARMASARGVVINLTQAIEPAPQSEAVLAARNGTIIGARTSGPPSHAKVDRDEMQFEAPQVDESLEYIEEASSADFDPDNPFANTTPDLPPSMRTKATRAIPLVKDKGTGEKRTAKYVAAGTLAVATVLAILGTVSFGRKLSELVAISSSKPEISKTEELKSPESNEAPNVGMSKQSANEPSNDSEGSKDSESGADSSNPMPDVPKKTTDETPGDQSETKKLYLDPLKIKIAVSQFYLQVKEADNLKANDAKIFLRAGIPNSCIDANISYEAEDEESKSLFEKLTTESDNFNWTWEVASDDGSDWKPIDGRTGLTLAIDTEDKPKTRFRSVLKIKNNESFDTRDEWVTITSGSSESTVDYVNIDVDINALQNNMADTEVPFAFPELFEPTYRVGFYGEGKLQTTSSERGDRINFIRLQQLMEEKDGEENFFDKCKQAVEALKSIDKSLVAIRGLSESSNNKLKSFCYEERTPDATLKISMNVFSDLSRMLPEIGRPAARWEFPSEMMFEQIVNWRKNRARDTMVKDVEKIIDPVERSKARLDNEEKGIVKESWIGDKQDGNRRKAERTGFELIDDLIDQKDRLLQLKNDIVGKEFFYIIPDGCVGVFLKSDKSQTTTDSLARKSKALFNVSFWIKVKLAQHNLPPPKNAGRDPRSPASTQSTNGIKN